MAFVDTYATRHLPRVVGAPPLPKLTGEEILPIAVAIRKQRDLAAYWNSITTLQLQQFIGTEVSDTPPHATVPGQMWWDEETKQLYVWTGTAWVPASCCKLKDDDDRGNVAMTEGPPCDVRPGALWWAGGELYVLTDDGWVAVSCCGGPVAFGCVPPQPAIAGSLWWNGQLYVYTGCEWVMVNKLTVGDIVAAGGAPIDSPSFLNHIRIMPMLVSELPDSNTVDVGTRATVSDATFATGVVGAFGGTGIDGGGSASIPVVVAIDPTLTSSPRWMSDLGRAAGPGNAIQYNNSSGGRRFEGSSLLTVAPGPPLGINIGSTSQGALTSSPYIRLYERLEARMLTIGPSDRVLSTTNVDMMILSGTAGARIGPNVTCFMSGTPVGWARSGLGGNNINSGDQTFVALQRVEPGGDNTSAVIEINAGSGPGRPGSGSQAFLRLNAGLSSVLPTPSPAYLGVRGTITNSDVTNFGDVVVPSGSAGPPHTNVMPVWCDGVNWRIG